MTAFANPLLGAYAGGFGAPMQQALGVQDFNSRLRQNAEQNTFDATKLQSAYAQMRGSTPTQSSTLAGASPMVSSIRAAKNLSRSTMLGGIDLSDDDQTNLDLLGRDNTVSPDAYDRQLQKIVNAHDRNQGVQTKLANAQADSQEKFNFAASLKNDPNFADEETRNQIRSMVSDPRTSMSELRITAAQIAQQKTAAQKQTDAEAKQSRTENYQNVRTELANVRPEMSDARELLMDKHPKIADLMAAADVQVGPELTKRLQAGRINQDDVTALMNYKRAEAQQRTLTGQLQQPSAAQPAASQSQYPDGATAVNPQTGHRIIHKGGQWLDAQTGVPING